MNTKYLYQLQLASKHLVLIGEDFNNHINNTNNPHKVSQTQVGLSNLTNDAQVKRSEMGVEDGVATLDEDVTIPATQLDIATKVDALNGSDNTKIMTPLRVKESIEPDCVKTKVSKV